VRAAGGGGLSSSSLGDGVGEGSPVYLKRRGKHQWERWTPAILPGRLARRGRQHNGVAAAKMVARVWARFGWGTPLGMTPYIGKLIPTTCKRCELQFYVIFVLIRSIFGWRSRGREGFPSRWRRKLGSSWGRWSPDRDGMGCTLVTGPWCGPREEKKEGAVLGLYWALREKQRGGERLSRLGFYQGSAPWPIEKWEKGFLFFKSFLNFKSI
jgi:hypothetical protein